MEVEVRKANENQQDIFHLQLLQGNSRIFAVIDFNPWRSPGEVKITTADDGKNSTWGDAKSDGVSLWEKTALPLLKL
ncbi:MAG: hypothetical protein ACR2LR_10885 [Hassallia sp.]